MSITDLTITSQNIERISIQLFMIAGAKTAELETFSNYGIHYNDHLD